MYSLKALLFTVFGLYLLAFGVILIQSLNSPITPTLYNKEPSKKSKGTSFLTLPSSDSPYRFSDPSLAYKILTQLDGYKTPFRAEVYKPDKKEAYLGLKKDSSYCERHRDYFVHHPESVFEQKNIITSWDTDSYFELILREMPNATDVHRNNMKSTTKELMKKHMFEMPINTNNYFSPYSFYNYYTMQEEYSCLSQTSSQIPGHTTITMKDEVCQAATDYVEMFKDRPHCISHDKYFPKGYVLSDKSQCKAFFNILKTKAHKDLLNERKIVYIKKNPRSHRGAGVMPLDKLQENKLIKEYKNGLSCGKIKKEIVVQHYVHNPLLLNGRKFDFRMYMLVASVNPLIAYYHDGLLRISLLPYDSKSTDKKVLLTNLILSEQIHQDAREGKKFEGMDEEDLRNAQQWNFTQLESYLLETGLTKDKNWLNNYLKPEFKKALIHLARMSSDNYVKHSSFYGLYGIDFMLDTDLKLWFIEVNAGPAFGGYSKPMDKIISKMLRDHFDVVFGLLRSRMKRVVSFVNKLIEDESVYVLKNGDVIIKDLDRTRRTFDEITKNYFEKEFELSPDNGFELIIDENLSGVDVYQGYVPQSCL